MIPLRTATEYANKVIRARVAAAPRLPRARARPRTTSTRPCPADAAAARRRARRRCAPGCGSGPGCSPPWSATSPTRPPRSPTGSGMCAPEASTTTCAWAAYPLTALRRADVRRRIVVSDTGATLFSGRLGDRLDVTGHAATRRRAPSTTASTDDILEALPDGLDTVVAERGRTLLRRPAAAAGAGPRAGRRPGDPGAGRADLRRRRPHRGPDRRPAARPPRRPHHGRGHHQPAGARRRRRGRLPAATAGSSPTGTHARPARPRRRLPRRRHPRGRAGRRSSADERHAPRCPSPTPASVRRYAAAWPAHAPAAALAARWRCTCSPRWPRWPRRGCSATWSRPSTSGTTVGHVDQVIAGAGRVPGRCRPCSPGTPATSARCSASRCWPSCARTSSATRSRCRSASSSRPARATC